jgi:hypothetical protein
MQKNPWRVLSTPCLHQRYPVSTASTVMLCLPVSRMLVDIAYNLAVLTFYGN